MSSTTASPSSADVEMGGDVVKITWAVLCAALRILMLMFLGAKLEHQGVLDPSKRKVLSALAMNLCLPCLLFADVLPGADMRLVAEGWHLLLWPLIYATVGGSLGVALCAVSCTPRQHWGAAAACAAFPNTNGFPVTIISALDAVLPPSPSGFTAMTFLAVIQLTDGMVKYTIGPMVFRRDLRAVRSARVRLGKDLEGELPELPLGASLRSICTEGVSASVAPAGRALPIAKPRPETLVRKAAELGRRVRASGPSCFGTIRELFPPQVMAVLFAFALGARPSWLKGAFYNPELAAKGVQPALGWVYGTARELGGGFVTLQMITLGGRMLNVLGTSGPLRATGEAGPHGRSRLLRVAASVGVARMLLTPLVLYGLALFLDHIWLHGSRPLAFWAAAFTVAAMPTANNMSTMADVIGSGRSISAASTALQLIVSPVVLVATLSALLVGIQTHLLADMGTQSSG